MMCIKDKTEDKNKQKKKFLIETFVILGRTSRICLDEKMLRSFENVS